MKIRWLGVAIVVALVGVVLAAKHGFQSHPAAGAAIGDRPPVRVVLVADPAEAESTCGCGEIIRLVRAAGARGVAVREVPPSDRETARLYGVKVAPSVVLLDEGGAVLRRHKGEDARAVAAIRADLDRLPGRP